MHLSGLVSVFLAKPYRRGKMMPRKNFVVRQSVYCRDKQYLYIIFQLKQLNTVNKCCFKLQEGMGLNYEN